MVQLIDHQGRDCTRTTSVGQLIEQRRVNAHSAQITAGTAEEAAAAEAAGIEMVVSLAQVVSDVRLGSKKLFVTAAIDFCGAVSDDDFLKAAYQALQDGADAIITGRRMKTVKRLTDEEIPVMGHLGFIPNKSTLYGGIRAVGKTAAEAAVLWEKFQRLEDAGAFGVECELIPAALMKEINERTGLVTVSLGSGQDADIMFLFCSDICGESERLPRHARAYANLAELRKQIVDERIRALTAYRKDVSSKEFPGEGEVANMNEDQLREFLQRLDDR